MVISLSAGSRATSAAEIGVRSRNSVSASMSFKRSTCASRSGAASVQIDTAWPAMVLKAASVRTTSA